MNPVVIRLSSLGDVVLTGAITKQLRAVTFITQPQYTDIARKLIGVQDVLTPQDPLPNKASVIIDLQDNWKSKKIRRAIHGPTSIIHKPRWQHWQHFCVRNLQFVVHTRSKTQSSKLSVEGAGRFKLKS